MSPPLKDGIDWLISKTSTDDGSIHLAQELLNGDGTYFDGTSIKKDPKSAYNILFSLSVKSNPKASFVLAQAIKEGQINFVPAYEADMFLQDSAQCGYVPAMIKLAELALSNDKKRETYGWYLMAYENGANVSAALEKAKKNVGSYLQMTIQRDSRFKVNMKRCQ